MSRTIPPTPVAAPWYGSTKLGWLCDSILNVTAKRSLTAITPAFSPMPASSRSERGAFSPNCRKWTLLDLYEQCSLHMIEYMYSSESVGRRPRIERTFAYSSSARPSSRYGCGRSGVVAARSTVSLPTKRSADSARPDSAPPGSAPPDSAPANSAPADSAPTDSAPTDSALTDAALAGSPAVTSPTSPDPPPSDSGIAEAPLACASAADRSRRDRRRLALRD